MLERALWVYLCDIPSLGGSVSAILGLFLDLYLGNTLGGATGPSVVPGIECGSACTVRESPAQCTKSLVPHILS